jgi:chorismate dehydratase
MLTEVIFREFYKIDPDKFQLHTNTSPYESKTDAFLIIGDPALKLATRGEWQYRYDVGEIWQQHTSLPFVFAAWITCRNKHYNVHPFALILSKARDKGRDAIPQIVLEHKEELPISPEKIENYLTNSIHHKIEQEERTALKKFFDLAKFHKIIPKRNKITFSDGTEV